MNKSFRSFARWAANALAVLAVALVPFGSSATTIGTNISTDGTLIVNGNTTIGNALTDTITITAVLQGASPLVFEGATVNDFETTIVSTDATADRTITLPDASGTVALAANVATLALDNLASVAINTSLISDTAATDNLGSAALYWNDLFLDNRISFEGTDGDGFVTYLLATDATAERTITLQDGTGTLAFMTDIPAVGATLALDNLASVAINTSLISDTAATDNLGSAALYWNDLFLDNRISFEGTDGDGFVTYLLATDATAERTITLQDGTGTLAFMTDIPAVGATLALDNLASVAINTSLISDTAATDNLGSAALYWNDLFLDNRISFEGTDGDGFVTYLLATDATAERTITLQDGTGTLAFMTDIPAVGATLALDNLASVAINTSLISDTAATDNLGSAALYWNDLFLDNRISFEGTDGDGFVTYLLATDATAERTITLPDTDGTIMVSEYSSNAVDTAFSIWGDVGALKFEGDTADGFETFLRVIDPTTENYIDLPNASGTAVITDGNGALTATSIGIDGDGTVEVNTCDDTDTISVTGAEVGDVVLLGAPSAIEAGLIPTAFVSDADTVTVRLCNVTAGGIAPSALTTWRVTVLNY